MATENKEKAKGEAIFPLTQEQINQIAAIGAKEGVRAYKEEQKKEERRRKKEDSKSERQRNCSARTEESRRHYRMESSSLRRSRQN